MSNEDWLKFWSRLGMVLLASAMGLAVILATISETTHSAWAWHLAAAAMAAAFIFAVSNCFLRCSLSKRNIELSTEMEQRLKGEESLRLREATLRSTFDGVNDAVVLHTMDGRLIDVNQTMLAMFGVSRPEALNLSLVEDFSSLRNDLTDMPRRWTLVQMGLPQFFPWIAKKPLTGVEFDVEMYLTRIALPEGEAILATIRDITDRKKTEEALIRAESAYRTIFENALDAIFQTHVSGRLIKANPATARLFGYDSPEDLMLSITDLSKQLYVDPQDRVKFLNTLARKGTVQNYEMRIRRKDGTIRWISLSARVNFDDFGRITTIDAVAQDATERKISEAELLERANIDEVTGLPNRFLFNEHLKIMINQAKRSGRKFAVLYIDLDGFKEVNDTLGHSQGDILLRKVGERLKGRLRESDIIARLGGDEFAALLWDIKDEEGVRQVGECLVGELARPFNLKGSAEAWISGSVGASVYPRDGEAARVLMENADQAMYSAKDIGKNSFRFFAEGRQ